MKNFRKKSHFAKPKPVVIPDIQHGLHIFCDGACEPNPGPGGWGVVAYQDGKETHTRHGGEAGTTNNRMELTSLLEALELAKRIGEPCVIWCDSDYAVRGANEWSVNWKKNGWQRKGSKADPKNRILLNADLWQHIDVAKAAVPLAAIRWCKGHVGITGNERADELSNEGLAAALAMDTGENDDYLTEQYRNIMAG